MGRPIERDDDEDDEDDDEDEESSRQSVAPDSDEVPLVRTVQNKKPQSIEDLYALFPEFGDGTNTFYVRLYRTWPKSFLNNNIQGRIGEWWTQIQYTDIQQQFGGGKYKLAIMGPSKGRANAAGDRPIREHMAFEFQLPGPPVPHSLMQDGESIQMSMTSPQGPQVMMPAGNIQQAPTAPTVQIKALEVQERAAERTQAREDANTRAQLEFATTSLKEARVQAQASIDALTLEKKHLTDTLYKKEEKITDLNATANRFQLEATTYQRQYDETKVAKENLERLLVSTKEDYRSKIDEIEKRYRDDKEELRRRLDDDRARLDRENTKEAERHREELRSRENTIKDDYERRLASQREQYEMRIGDLTRQGAQQLDLVREQRDREVKAAESSSKQEIQLAKTMYETRALALENENKRLIAQVDEERKKRESIEAANKPKNIMTQLAEAKQLATLTGMIDKDDIPAGGEDDGPFDIKKVLAKGVLGLIDKAPEALAQIQSARAQNAAMRQQQGQQQRRRQRPMMAPPPNTYQQQAQLSPNGIIAPVRSASAPQYMPPPQQQQVQQQPQPQQRTVQEQPVQQQQQPVNVQPVQEQNPLNAISQEDQLKYVQEFVVELGSAIDQEVVPPGLFAQGVIDRIGPDMAGHIMYRLNPADFINMVEQQDPNNPIARRDGKQYTMAVWTEAKRRLGL